MPNKGIESIRTAEKGSRASGFGGVMLELEFLGTGSAYNPAQKNTSCYVMIGGTTVLFDCGETVFETLYGQGLLEWADRLLVAITHFHSDHCGSLGSLLSYCRCCLNKQVEVLYPSRDICRLLGLMGVPEDMYTYRTDVPEGLGFTLTAVPVEHDPLIGCFGYLLQAGEEALFYGGDSTHVPPEILEGLVSGRLCRVYQDVSYEREHPGAIHGSLEQLCAQIPLKHRKNVVCMHFGSEFSEKIEEQGFIPARVRRGNSDGSDSPDLILPLHRRT